LPRPYGLCGRDARAPRFCQARLEFGFADGVAFGVAIVDDGDAVGDVEFDDLLLVEVVEFHDDGAEAVAMRGDDDVLPILERGHDLVVEVGQRTRGGVLEAFAVRRRNIVTAPPDFDLRVAEFLGCLRLVQPLQVSIVALIERLIVTGRNALLPGCPQADGQGVNGAFQDGGERLIQMDARQGDLLSGVFRLISAHIGEFDVYPAGEAVSRFQSDCPCRSSTSLAKFLLLNKISPSSPMRR